MPVLETISQSQPSARPYVPDPEIPYPDTSLLVTEDDTPVDNILTEIQQRLLVDPLYASWKLDDGRPFRAMSNVGLFHAYKEPPNVPDVMVAFGMPPSEGLNKPDHRSYFMWVVGKPPDIVIEIVSNTYGGEDTTKLRHYESIGVRFYVIYDPFQKLDSEMLRVFSARSGFYEQIDPSKINSTGLGLTLWKGVYENQRETWLRWTDAKGTLLPTGLERNELERKRTNEANKALAEERERIVELEAKIKTLESKDGILK